MATKRTREEAKCRPKRKNIERFSSIYFPKRKNKLRRIFPLSSPDSNRCDSPLDTRTSVCSRDSHSDPTNRIWGTEASSMGGEGEEEEELRRWERPSAEFLLLLPLRSRRFVPLRLRSLHFDFAIRRGDVPLRFRTRRIERWNSTLWFQGLWLCTRAHLHCKGTNTDRQRSTSISLPLSVFRPFLSLWFLLRVEIFSRKAKIDKEKEEFFFFTRGENRIGSSFRRWTERTKWLWQTFDKDKNPLEWGWPTISTSGMKQNLGSKLQKNRGSKRKRKN